jgi:hypothetical protein
VFASLLRNLLCKLAKAWQYSWRAIVALSVLVTIAVGLPYFFPRMTVEPSSETIDDSFPSSVSFIITNTGIIPLRDIQPYVGVCSVTLYVTPTGPTPAPIPRPPSTAKKCQGSLYEKKVGPPNWHRRDLGIDERYTIAIHEAININAATTAYDISIIVDYKPWFMPWTQHKEFPYESREMADGKLHWFARPLEE